MSENTFVKFYGNEIANIVSLGTTGKQYHAFYLTTDSNHQEVGWNSIHNNHSCRAMQVHSSPNNLTSGYNQYDISIHDNLIHDDPCDGMNLATVDPSQGKVEVYNNLIYHVGLGPDPLDGEASYSCIRVAQYTNNGAPGTGTVEVYNNTLADCGSHIGTFGLAGAFDFSPGTVGVNIRNNIIYQNSGEFFNDSGSLPSGFPLTGSNNIWFGGSQVIPTWSTNNITADPLFANRSINDFHLQSGSPAIGAAPIVNSSNAYKNYPPWQGGIAVDRDGLIRPSPSSIGAYEFTGGTPPQRPNPPTNLKVTVQ